MRSRRGAHGVIGKLVDVMGDAIGRCVLPAGAKDVTGRIGVTWRLAIGGSWARALVAGIDAGRKRGRLASKIAVKDVGPRIGSWVMRAA